MKKLVSMCMVLASLSGCGGGEEEFGATIRVAKASGMKQCSADGLTLEQMQAQLNAVKVMVQCAKMASDGAAYPTVCGQPDGSIGVFRIDAGQEAAAASAGFKRLTAFPQATTDACR